MRNVKLKKSKKAMPSKKTTTYKGTDNKSTSGRGATKVKKLKKGMIKKRPAG